MSVSKDDIMHHLVARCGAPSSFGAQLERLRFGTTPCPDPFQSRADAESRMLEQAQILRCISDFKERADFSQHFQSPYRQLLRVQRRCNANQGAIALGILHEYQEWATSSQERGLVAVYNYVSKLAPGYLPKPPKEETDLLQAFRSGKALRARSAAAEAVADAILALDSHLRSWNERETRKRS